jgi:hypothetical protein
MDELRQQLAEARDRIRSHREERARLRKVFDAAKSALAENQTEATTAAGLAARDSLKEVDQKLEQAQDHRAGLLERLADAEAGRSGFPLPGVNGWEEAARRLDMQHGETRVDLAGGALMRPMAAVTVENLAGSGAAVRRIPAAAPPQDRRFAYPALMRRPVDAGDLAVGGFTVSFGSDPVSGAVERDPMATTAKAELGATVGWDSKDLRQFAVTLDEIPVKVLEVEDQLRALLESEARYRIDLAFDDHVVSAIEAAAPPSGSTGTGMISQVRNAVAASRDLGANPTTLLLNPTDAAALDLTTTGADGMFLFATRGTGSASPLWDLTIRESESITDPILIDPVLIGPLAIGTGTVMADAFTKMERNIIRLRVEIEALAFVRDPRGAYVIA